MSFWNSRNVKKTRKKHICMFCQAAIPIGSSCSHESGIYEGELNDYYLCNRCHTLLSSKKEPWVDPYESTIGDFLDCLMETDVLYCPHCGKYHSVRDFDWSEDMMFVEAVCDNCDWHYIVDLSAENLLKEANNGTED